MKKKPLFIHIGTMKLYFFPVVSYFFATWRRKKPIFIHISAGFHIFFSMFWVGRLYVFIHLPLRVFPSHSPNTSATLSTRRPCMHIGLPISRRFSMTYATASCHAL